MKNELKRHDLKTRALITIANKFNKKNKFKWFNYNEFKDIEISIIKKDINITDNNEINKNVSNLNNIYEIDETYYLNKLNIGNTEEEYDEYNSENSDNENIIEITDDNIVLEKSQNINDNTNILDIEVFFKKNNHFKNFEDVINLGSRECNLIDDEKEKKINIKKDIKENKIKKINYPKTKKRTYNEVKKDINEKEVFPGTKLLKES